MLRRIAITPLFCLLAGLFRPADAAAGADWVKATAKEFTVLGNTGESQIRGLAGAIDAFIRAVSAELPRGELPGDLTIIVFRDEASFESFKPEHQGARKNSAGYFLAGRAANFISVADRVETRRVLYHEVFHAVSRPYVFPTWASEGLAEFYSTMDTGFGSAVPAHVATLRTRPWIPLAAVLTATRDSSFYNDAELQKVFYAECWLLTHYLLTRNGSSPETLLANAPKLDASAAEAELRSYLSGFALEAVPAAPVLRPAGSTAAVAPVTDSEAAASLGSLLLQFDRLDAATDQLQRAVQSQPVFPAAFIEMGLLQMWQNRSAQALYWFRKGVDADPANHLAHFYYAQTLQALSLFEPSLAHLRKAIELEPRFSEPYIWLGYVTMALKDRYQDADNLLSRAIAQDPLNEGLSDTLTRLRTAAAANLQSESTRRDRAARRQLAQTLALLRVAPPAAVAQYTPPAPLLPTPRRVARKPAVVYPSLEGLLTLIDCRQGITLVLRVNNAVVRFNTRTPIKLEFTSKVSNAANEAACGWVRPEARVVVTYKPSKDAPHLGEPIRIEYK
jgi:tetratricopeptide (TPR) repeat protein